LEVEGSLLAADALAAADNNARWCDAVCRSHGLATRFADDLWIALEGSPTFYPDVAAPTLHWAAVGDELEEWTEAAGLEGIIRAEPLAHALASGFSEIQPLRIWVREAPGSQSGSS
jgi:hypothetical protein